MVLEDIKQVLESEAKEIGAASCTFYVRDPFWPDELRLIAMPGVHYAEPMHGFTFPPHSKRVVAEGDPEIFSPDSDEAEGPLREAAGAPRDQIDTTKSHLFGDFVERENIKSSARLTHKVNGRIEAVLFVNFVEKTKFDKPLKLRLRKLLTRLAESLQELNLELRISEAGALVQAIRMFPPTYQGSTKLHDWDQPLPDYLRSLLGVAIAALELDLASTFGTIHLYDRRTATLRLAAALGGVDEQRANSQSVATGEGIISWVAIRRKALLIADFAGSAFAGIHIPINSGEPTRSEVAIPIFAGHELLGVLNLESSKPHAFQPICVRSLWFAVNRAAVAQRMSSINDRMKVLIDGLLELCGEAVRNGTGKFSLNRLADLAARELYAARCGIWRYIEKQDTFELAGVSPANLQPVAPRSTGWSKLLRQLGWPVWITRKETGSGFDIRYWSGADWDQPPPHQKPPKEINSSVREDVKSLLGIPIKVGHQDIGIAWLEYESNQKTPPENELMKLASGFADYAGLVIEFSQVDFVDQDAVQRIGDKLSENLLASGPLKLDGFPRIEGYVRSEPFPNSRIGGDFHAARVIDEQTAGVLVGDGEGHAVTGALNMLPMLTVFEAFWKESRSVTHIMDKIRGISNQLSVKGTAIYCVFSVIEKTLWLSCTSAGHPSLVIFGKEDTYSFPREGSTARGSMLGVPWLREPPAEDHIKLSSDDLIIFSTDGLDVDFSDISEVGAAHKKKGTQAVANAVFEKALKKRKGKPLDDDATVMVIRVK